jgi:L-alanine-DL-glutamate epimerase-like enolase superfamily enzyme
MLTTATSATSAIAVGSLITHADLESISAQMNTNSKPSALRITDMRGVVASPLYERDLRYLFRLETNQGIYGWGDVRAQASMTYALELKKLIVGMNPCDVSSIFSRIKQHGGNGVTGGGVSAVEMACWDLAGKAYGVPVYQMLGGKVRDKILLYADTTSSTNAEEMAKHLLERIPETPSAGGFKFLKMDLNFGAIAGAENVIRPPAAPAAGQAGRGGPGGPGGMGMGGMGMGGGVRTGYYNGGQITEKGLKRIEDFCAAVREKVGWNIPIACDHVGSFNVETLIKCIQTMDRFNLAWVEDPVPWQYTDDLVRIKNSVKTPINTGEDIYLATGFKDLFEKRAVSIIHPDLAECGGILEGKKISDLATQHGIATLFHNHNNPTCCFASAHAAAATEQFMALEIHDCDHIDEFFSVVTGWPKPIISNGFMTVSDAPGLGHDYDLEGLKKWLKRPGFFEPTTEWDNMSAGMM